MFGNFEAIVEFGDVCGHEVDLYSFSFEVSSEGDQFFLGAE